MTITREFNVYNPSRVSFYFEKKTLIYKIDTGIGIGIEIVPLVDNSEKQASW